MICSLRGATIMLALFLLAMSSAEAKRPRFEIPEIPEAFRDAPAVVLSDANSSIIFVEPPRATVHWKRRRVLLQTPEGLDAADQVFH